MIRLHISTDISDNILVDILKVIFETKSVMYR